MKLPDHANYNIYVYIFFFQGGVIVGTYNHEAENTFTAAADHVNNRSSGNLARLMQ